MLIVNSQQFVRNWLSFTLNLMSLILIVPHSKSGAVPMSSLSGVG